MPGVSYHMPIISLHMPAYGWHLLLRCPLRGLPYAWFFLVILLHMLPYACVFLAYAGIWLAYGWFSLAYGWHMEKVSFSYVLGASIWLAICLFFPGGFAAYAPICLGFCGHMKQEPGETLAYGWHMDTGT